MYQVNVTSMHVLGCLRYRGIRNVIYSVINVLLIQLVVFEKLQIERKDVQVFYFEAN